MKFLTPVVAGSTTIPTFLGSFDTTSHVFSSETQNFVNTLSKRLLAQQHSQFAPDLTALGFWCRQSNIDALKKAFESRVAASQFIRPAGIVFQVAPGNVEALFLYTGLLALLLGNTMVTRVSSKKSALFDELLIIINSVLDQPEHLSVAKRFFIIDMEHSDPGFTELSKVCDLRILWGADDTVYQLRQTPLSAHAKELTFAGKTSLALISGNGLNQIKRENSEEYARILECFYRDAFTFNQQACASTRVVVWLGQIDEGFLQTFWQDLEVYVQHRNHGAYASSAMLRLTGAQSLAAAGVEIMEVKELSSFTVLKVSRLGVEIHDHHFGHGLFVEQKVATLEALTSVLDSKYQSLTYIGISKEEIAEWLGLSGGCGLSRVVPVGQSLTFETVWDGYDLMAEMTRQVTVR